jgi:hypothetical protein
MRVQEAIQLFRAGSSVRGLSSWSSATFGSQPREMASHEAWLVDSAPALTFGSAESMLSLALATVCPLHGVGCVRRITVPVEFVFL